MHRLENFSSNVDNYRDIKPQNIMFTVPGDLLSLKLIDWGLCGTFATDRLTSRPIGTVSFLHKFEGYLYSS